MHDIWGYETGLPEQSGLEAWNAMQGAFLGHKARTANDLAEVLRLAPDFAAAQSARGLFMLLLGRSELVPTAREAHAAARPEDMRGRLMTEALGAWLSGSLTQATLHIDAIVARYPRDAFAMKLSHAMRFMAGDIDGMRAALDLVAPHYDTDHPAYGYYLGCRAFALEETGEYTAARRAGEAGLVHAPDDAWGLHAVAHVHDMTGNSREGLNWLTGREAAWAECNNFRYHVWWHKALMHLDQGEADEALALYDNEVRKDRTDDYRDISNATSLLMRLELEGHAVGDRWDELAELCAQRTDDGALIFADLHYLLGLVGGERGEAQARLIGRIRADADAATCDQHRVAAHPGLAAAEGLAAFGEGHYALAFARLAAARRAMQSIGGSHAQRDIFERITIDAGIRAGRSEDAEFLLNERRNRRGGADDLFARARRTLLAQKQLSPAAE